MNHSYIAIATNNRLQVQKMIDLFLGVADQDDELILVDQESSKANKLLFESLLTFDERIRPVQHFVPISKERALHSALRACRWEQIRHLKISEDGGAVTINTTKTKEVAFSKTTLKEVDLLFAPHNGYHVWTIALLLPQLMEAGISCAVVDITPHIKDENVASRAEELNLTCISYSDLVFDKVRPRNIAVFNDWEAVSRALLTAAQLANIGTISIVEGIQDYDDKDTGRRRDAYRMSDNVILPGKFDLRYFDSTQNLQCGGVPRIMALSELTNTEPPLERVAVINSNFTYGVLENWRAAWLSSAIDACNTAGFRPVISRHHADNGREFTELETKLPVYDALKRSSVLITRFSSLILESLALNRPVVYYKPQMERVDKFLDPKGAFQIASTQPELAKSLDFVNNNPAPPNVEASHFLNLHANIGAKESHGVSEILTEIVNNSKPKGIDYKLFRSKLRKIDLASRSLTNKFVLTDFPARYFSGSPTISQLPSWIKRTPAS
jgi:hypothetical protein